MLKGIETLSKDTKILITGAAGLIGSGMVRYLNDLGFENLVLVDHLGKDDKWKNLVNKKYEDIVHPTQIRTYLNEQGKDVFGIVHLGACSSTVEKDADYLLDNNYRFSKDLALWSLENGARFIYASSAATYGDGSLGFEDDENRIEHLRPMNMYGYSKQLFDLWLKRKGLLSKVIGLKYFNVFGPNEAHKERMASAVYKFYRQIKNGNDVKLFCSCEPEKYRDGDQERDFIYVKDAVKMTTAFLMTEKDVGGLFNIGRGTVGTWNQVAKAVFKALDIKEKIGYIEMPEDLIGKYQNHTLADMKKTKNVLGSYADCESLEVSIEDYVNQHLEKELVW